MYKSITKWTGIIILLSLLTPIVPVFGKSQLAFPGAEGFGRFADLKLGFKLDCAGDIENDCAGAVGRLDSVPERADPLVFEISNMINVATASSFGADR